MWGLLIALAGGDWRRQAAPLVAAVSEDWATTGDLLTEVVGRLFPSSLVLIVLVFALVLVSCCFGGVVGFLLGRWGPREIVRRRPASGDFHRLRAYAD